MLLKEDAAARLGMAVHEVVSVEAVDGGHVVVTHDGYPTLIADDGGLVFGADAIGERLAPAVQAPAVDDDEPDEAPDVAPKPSSARGRAKSDKAAG
jgi:hypothetical protein